MNLTSMIGNTRPWGNIVLSDENSNFVSSPHRSSSGQTSEIQRKGGRKARKEHYTRKAILEREKEEKRRRAWEKLHPGASESNWRRREERRKTRRATRHLTRKRKTSTH